MVALPFADHIVKIRFIGQTFGAPFIHVMHGQFNAPFVVTADLNTFAAQLKTLYATNFAPQLNTSTSITSIEVTDLSNATGAQGFDTTGVTGTAGALGTYPRSACCVVSWKQTLHFRGGHPRTYLPLRNGTALLNSFQLDPTYVSAVQSAARAFLTSFNATTLAGSPVSLVMLSYFQHHAIRPTPAPFPILTATVHPRVDTQRRRLGKETS